MTLKATLSTSPLTLTVTSDKRKISGNVTVAGETANYTGAFEPVVTDDSGRKWTKTTDDQTTAVYTALS
jgi:hypothetical protein